MTIKDNHFIIDFYQNPFEYTITSNFIVTNSMLTKLKNTAADCLDAYEKGAEATFHYRTILNSLRLDQSNSKENNSPEYVWYKQNEYSAIRLEEKISKRVGDYFLATDIVTEHFNNVFTTLHRFKDNNLGTKTRIEKNAFQMYLSMSGINRLNLYKGKDNLGTSVTLEQNQAILFLPVEDTFISFESTNADLISVKFCL